MLYLNFAFQIHRYVEIQIIIGQSTIQYQLFKIYVTRNDQYRYIYIYICEAFFFMNICENYLEFKIWKAWHYIYTYII